MKGFFQSFFARCTFSSQWPNKNQIELGSIYFEIYHRLRKKLNKLMLEISFIISTNGLNFFCKLFQIYKFIFPCHLKQTANSKI